jgi:hypothetical protein
MSNINDIDTNNLANNVSQKIEAITGTTLKEKNLESIKSIRLPSDKF